ncbi:MAG: hypothetical protein ACUVWP_07630 [bacterium]
MRSKTEKDKYIGVFTDILILFLRLFKYILAISSATPLEQM